MIEEAEKWKIMLSEEIANCRVFKVRRDLSIRENDTDEKEAHSFFVIESPEWVNIIPVTKDGKVVMIEQYRHGIGEITLEIPGGLVDGDEKPEIAAERELLEETGYAPREVVFLGKSRPNPAIQDNWVYHYLALDCEKIQEPEFDSTEHAKTKLIEKSYISEAISNGEISHSLVIAAFYWLRLKENK
jgi:ADP-ribose pyrophosphatase